MTDVLVLYNGSDKESFRVAPLTERGTEWLQRNSPAESWCGHVLVVPAKIIERYTIKMAAAGLILGGES